MYVLSFFSLFLKGESRKMKSVELELFNDYSFDTRIIRIHVWYYRGGSSFEKQTETREVGRRAEKEGTHTSFSRRLLLLGI